MCAICVHIFFFKKKWEGGGHSKCDAMDAIGAPMGGPKRDEADEEGEDGVMGGAEGEADAKGGHREDEGEGVAAMVEELAEGGAAFFFSGLLSEEGGGEAGGLEGRPARRGFGT
jgi:hypothetical protein